MRDASVVRGVDVLPVFDGVLGLLRLLQTLVLPSEPPSVMSLAGQTRKYS
jgi:hypothetical protein